MLYKGLSLLLLSVLVLGGCASDASYQERVNNYCLQESLKIGPHHQGHSTETGQPGGNGPYRHPTETNCFVGSDSE